MALAGMVMGHRTEIQEAMSADFGVHPALATDLIEILGVAGRAAYAAEHLGAWMATEPRDADPALFGIRPGLRAAAAKGRRRQHQPLELPLRPSIGPLVEMLAAGNRVVIKPSEYTPACAALMRDMVHATFDRDRVDVAVRRPRAREGVHRVRWDHLLYTGSPAVGREIAVAAAEQLVPVTLELGGKCPAILAEDSIDAESVKQVLGTKSLKNGQMCISIDYCLVPRDQVEEFAQLAGRTSARRCPGSRVGRQRRDHQPAPSRADPGAARRGARSRLRRTRLEERAELDPDDASCRSRWCSTRPTTCR